jgi:ClpP class serine protease
MKINPFLAQFTDEPSLVAKGMIGRFEANLNGLATHPRIDEIMADQMGADDTYWPAADDWRSAYRPYIVQDGVLQIPIKGVLLHQFSWQLGNWATGYDYIWRAFKRGMADFGVLGIALVVDSPGGMVAGNYDLVDKMFAMRGTKPVRGYADTCAYSAAYNIISVADPKGVIVDRAGGMGSIGTLTMHIDQSGALDQAGIKVTYISSPKDGHKTDGNSTEPLAADVEDRIQARLDELYEVFVSQVARNRGMDAQAIRDTKALTFTATQAVSNGLADSIGSLDDSVAAFVADLCSTDDNGDDEMSVKENTAVDQAAIDTARSEGFAAGKAEGVTEGAKAEQTRISAILNSEEAKGRGALATHLAMNTDNTPEAAKGILAASAKEGADAGEKPSGFEEAMNNGQQPNLGGGDPGASSVSASDRILAARFGTPKAK